MQEVLQEFEQFFAKLCEHIGEDTNREGLTNTPKRILESFQTLFSGYSQNPQELLGATFKEGLCDEMVIAKDIEFYSMCEHHLLPFFLLIFS